MGLTVIRLVVHPVIWSIVLFYFRTIQRHVGRVKDLTQMCFIVWPVMYASLYGRFLLLQLNSVGSIVVMNFMMACFQIAGELNDRGMDDFWLFLLYGKSAVDAMQATRVRSIAYRVIRESYCNEIICHHHGEVMSFKF